ncbi:MAG TPA: hypothetical protein VGF25_12305, partial [Thermoleophilaceae bacterium]
AQLAVEDDVDDDEPVRGAVAADRVAVRAERLRGRDGVAPVGQALPGALQARVGERAPELLRVCADLGRAVERLGRQRILVADVRPAERRERVGMATRPGALPAIEEIVERGAQNSARPSSGVEACA